MTTQPIKCAAIAVAKDEAAYIHEWVHHHLYMGFSPLLIGINRTTDATRLILAKIQAQHADVHVFNLDWIDTARALDEAQNSTMQASAYAYLLETLRREHADTGYAGFFDTDEFWCTNDFTGTIQDWIADTPSFDLASFNWACQIGDPEEFSPPFAWRTARLRRHVKTIINMNAYDHIDRMAAHCPILKEGDLANHIDANGDTFAPTYGFKSTQAPAFPQNAFVLHRITRSEREYIAGLRKGMLGASTPIKTNRTGFYRMSDEQQMALDHGAVAKYHDALQAFTQTCQIEDMVCSARAEVTVMADNVLSLPRHDLLSALHYFLVALRGTPAQEKLKEKVAAYAPLTDGEKTLLAKSADYLLQHHPEMTPALEYLQKLQK